MAQQKSEDRVVLEGGVMPAELAGSSPGGQRKAVPVDQTAVQLELPIATAEHRTGSRTGSGMGRAVVPKAIVNAEIGTEVTMEEVAKRLTPALLKVALNKGAPARTGRRSSRCVSSGRPLSHDCEPICWMGRMDRA
jgi:hypothetical protein